MLLFSFSIDILCVMEKKTRTIQLYQFYQNVKGWQLIESTSMVHSVQMKIDNTKFITKIKAHFFVVGCHVSLFFILVPYHNYRQMQSLSEIFRIDWMEFTDIIVFWSKFSILFPKFLEYFQSECSLKWQCVCINHWKYGVWCNLQWSVIHMLGQI